MASNTSRSGDVPDRHRLRVAAKRYAAHGWPVLPLHTADRSGCSCAARTCGSPGKHPRTRGGLHEASTDLRTVDGWWSRWPDANIGVATGVTARLLVLDVDLPDGPDSMERLQAEHGALPATCTQRTGSGGHQLLFEHPGATIGNRCRMLPGLDVRGDGGYIVVPPSRHASGERYQWIARHQPAPPPDWLSELLIERARDAPVARADPMAPVAVAGDRDRRYAATALHRELSRLASAVEGTRNDTLNRAAFALGQLVAGGALDHDVVVARLERVASDIGLGPRETRQTIASGLRAGVGQPRTAPELPVRHPATERGPAPVRRLGGRRR